MKNLFLNFNSEKYRENGRFLFEKVETKELFRENLAKIETQKVFESTRKEQASLSVNAKTREKLAQEFKLSDNKKEVVENPVKKQETNKGSAESKEFTPQEAEKFAKDCMEKVALQDPSFQKALESSDPAAAIRDYTKNPPQESREKFLEQLKIEAPKHKWSKHLTIGLENPENLGNFAKIFTAFFAVGSISHEGGFKDSAMKGLRWGATAAALSHPAVTGTVSHILKSVGKGGYKIASYPVSALVNFIYEPGKFIDQVKNGENPLIKSDMVESIEMMKTSMDPLILRKKGMNFSGELNSIFDTMNSGKDKAEISTKIRPQAVKFLAQTENLASSTDPKDVSMWAFNIFQNNPKQKVSDEQYRLVLMMKSREKIIDFFKDDKNLSGEVEYKLKSIQNDLNSESKDKLKEYGIEDLGQVMAVGGENFAEMTKEKKHGVMRALSNMSGTSLIAYIMIFLLAKGFMSGSSLLQKGWKKSKDVRKNLKEQPIKTIASGIFFPFKKIGQGMSYLWHRPLQRKKGRALVAKLGKERFQWTDEQLKAYEALPKKERNKVGKKLKEMMETKESGTKKKMEDLRKKYKKDRKWWKLFISGTDTKGLKADDNYDKIVKEIEEMKEGVLKNSNYFTNDEVKTAFSVIKEVKGYDKIFPATP